MFKKILIPIDGAPASIQPLRTAIELVRINGGSIVVLSMASPRLYNGQEPDALEAGTLVEEKNRNIASVLMVDMMNSANAKNVHSETVVVQSATPHTEIIKAAVQYRCDAIFMGAERKQGLMEKIFDQNITHAVIQNAPVPVLVLP
jgi:nucleotide-binding universal stress UspA family protein